MTERQEPAPRGAVGRRRSIVRGRAARGAGALCWMEDWVHATARADWRASRASPASGRANSQSLWGSRRMKSRSRTRGGAAARRYQIR